MIDEVQASPHSAPYLLQSFKVLALVFASGLGVGLLIWAAWRKFVQKMLLGIGSSGVLSLFVLLIFSSAVYGCMYLIVNRLGMQPGYWIVPIFGATGGLSGALLRSKGRIHLATVDFSKHGIHLGFVNDMAMGVAGSIGFLFLTRSTINADPEKTATYPLLILVCFLAGVFGQLIVEVAGRKLVEEKLDKVQDEIYILAKDSAKVYVLYAREALDRGDYLEALTQSERALKADPELDSAYIEKARAFRKLNKLDEAIRLLEEVATRTRPGSEKDKINESVILFNLVCYRLQAKTISEEEAIRQLKRSFEKSNTAAIGIRKDPDLAVLRENEEFKSLMAWSDTLEK
jgi:hypothetical protein